MGMEALGGGEGLDGGVVVEKGLVLVPGEAEEVTCSCAIHLFW